MRPAPLVVDRRATARPLLLAAPPASGKPAGKSGGYVGQTADDYLPRVSLRRGACGPAVELWQRWLVSLARVLGTPAPSVDGVFGSGTHTATVAAQRALGVAADGVVGPKTRSAAFVRLSLVAANYRPVPNPTAGLTTCPSSSSASSSGGGSAGNSTEAGGERSFLDVIVENPVISVSAGVLAVIAISRMKR